MLLMMQLLLFLFSVAILCSLVCAQKWVPVPNTPWQWQLGAPIDTSYPAIVFVIDLFDAPDADINQLKRMGRRIVCDFGTAATKVPDIKSVSSVISYARVRGCDAILPPSLSKFSQYRGNLDAQLVYSKAIAKESHSQKISIGLYDDLDSIPYLVSNFDFLLIVDCMAGEDCEKAEPFKQAGKAIFHAELETFNMVPPQMTCRNLPAVYNTLFKERSLGSLSFTCSDFGIWSSAPAGSRRQAALPASVNRAMPVPPKAGNTLQAGPRRQAALPASVNRAMPVPPKVGNTLQAGSRRQAALPASVNRAMPVPPKVGNTLQAESPRPQAGFHTQVNLPGINEPRSKLNLQSAGRQMPMQAPKRNNLETASANKLIESPSVRNAHTSYQLQVAQQSEYSKLLSQMNYVNLNGYRDINPFMYDLYDIDLPDEMPRLTNPKPPRWPSRPRSNAREQFRPMNSNLQPERIPLTAAESSAHSQPVGVGSLALNRGRSGLQYHEVGTPKQAHLQAMPSNGNMMLLTKQIDDRSHYAKNIEGLHNTLATAQTYLNNIETFAQHQQQHQQQHKNNYNNKQIFDSETLPSLTSALPKQVKDKNHTHRSKDDQPFYPNKTTASNAIVFKTELTGSETTEKLTNAGIVNIVQSTTAKMWTNQISPRSTSDFVSINANDIKEDRSVTIGNFEAKSSHNPKLNITAVKDKPKILTNQVLNEQRIDASNESKTEPTSISVRSSTEIKSRKNSPRVQEITAVKDKTKTLTNQVLNEQRINASDESKTEPTSISVSSSTEINSGRDSSRVQEIPHLPNEEKINIFPTTETSNQMIHSKNADSLSVGSSKEIPVPIRHLDLGIDFIDLTSTPGRNKAFTEGGEK